MKDNNSQRKNIHKDTSDKFYNSPLVDEKYKDIMGVIDPLLKDICEGNGRKHINQNLIKKTYMDSITKRNKEWTKSHTCMYPYCNKKSIKRSHSIQRATSLKLISEKGYVLTPTLIERPDKLEYIMQPIGIKDASTFPGFCEEHEKIFNSYEIDGIFKEDKDYKLQVFRAICREIAFKNNELEWMEKSYEAYMNLIQNLFINKIEDHCGKKIDKIGIRSIKFDKYDYKSKLHNDSIRELKNTLNELKDLYKSCLEDRIYNINIKVPFQIPVAILGISDTILFNEVKNIDEDAIIILNCLPFENSIEVIVSCLDHYKDSFLKFIKYKTQTPLTMLNFIESFMVNGTEHWFIKGSVWNVLEDQKKRQILNDIFYSNWNIKLDYQYSIFDEIRKKLINDAEKTISENKGSQSLINHINAEKRKLLKLPQKINENIVDLTYKAAKLRLEKIEEENNSDKGK